MRPDVVGMVAIMLVSTPVSLTLSQAPRAATAGKLEGHVRDSTGLPMPSAQVWIDGTAYGGVADTRGYYFIDNIPPRVVDLTVTHVGYHRVQLKGVRILNGSTIAQDFSLDPVGPELVEFEQPHAPQLQQVETGIDTGRGAARSGKGIDIARIATGLLTEISSAVIDSAKRAVVGRLFGNDLRGLLGQVTTLAGQPIAGAKVEIGGGSYVLTGEDGRFLIQPPVGRKFTVRVSAPGYSTLETPLDKLKGGEGRRVYLRLR